MTPTAATRGTEGNSAAPALYLAFELGNTSWKLGFTTGLGQRPRERPIAARDLGTLAVEPGRAKQRFGLPAEVRVVSCYEAGRDGFWLHRYLVAQGIESHVVDSASIEVNRRKRRAKSDRLEWEGCCSWCATPQGSARCGVWSTCRRRRRRIGGRRTGSC